MFRSSPDIFFKNDVVKKSTKFKGKHLCCLFIYKVQTSGTGMFDEFCKIFKNGFIDRFPLEAGSKCF